MRTTLRTGPLNRVSGFSIIELLIAVLLLSGVLLIVNTSVQREGDVFADLTSRANQEVKGQALIGQIRELLDNAQACQPRGFITGAAGPGDTASLDVDTIEGFPDVGVLIANPGAGSAERIGYQGFSNAGAPRFTTLERAAGPCAAASAHAPGTPVMWAGTGLVIDNQVAPPANAFDGRSAELSGPLFFRGEGTGFSFRVPTDPAGGSDYFDGIDVRWGSTVSGTPLVTGRSAIRYVPESQVTEAELARDLNSDGDRDDTFDLGPLRVRTWDTRDAGAASSEYQLSGSGVLQELCNHGGDLDSDGFEDPMFLFDENTGRLRVRLFLLDRPSSQTVLTRRVETVLHLKNPVEN